jgi:hypothetical protein
MILVKCSGCGKTSKGGDHWAGRSGRCPGCGTEFIVPSRLTAIATKSVARQVIQQSPPPQVYATPSAGPIVNVNAGNGPRWDPEVATLLSVIIPGAGQMYKGQISNGVAWFCLTAVGYLLILPGVLFHICCVIGASTGRPDDLTTPED